MTSLTYSFERKRKKKEKKKGRKLALKPFHGVYKVVTKKTKTKTKTKKKKPLYK